MLALDDQDINQVLNHMGHTWDVHRDYYRQYDKVVERLDIAKLLLIQDNNKLHENKKKALAEIALVPEQLRQQLQNLDFQGKVSIKHVRPCKFTIWTLSGVYSRGKVIKGAKDSHVHFVSNF